MPIAKNWASATPSYIKENVPTRKGIYELQSGGHLVYIGKAENLRRRMLDHVAEKNPDKCRFKIAEIYPTPRRMESDELDTFEEKHGRLPSWNRDEAAE